MISRTFLPPLASALTIALIGCTGAGTGAGADADAGADTDAGASTDAGANTDTDAGADAGAVMPASVNIITDADAGADGGGIAPAPCPADMALSGRCCVDRHEAHLAFETESRELTIHPHQKRPEPGVRYIARSTPGVFPQAYISRIEAKAACVAAGKRLCTRREWQRACRGKGIYRYPYGPRGERGRCATGKPHLLTELFGDKKGGWEYEEHFNSPELALAPGYLDRTGAHEGCVSELGIYDMVGNLHEWVSDMVDQDFMDRLAEEEVERREQPWHEGNGVFVGGFFSTTSELGPGCYYTTVAHEPAYHDYSTGFRCCANAILPDPPRGKKSGR